MKFAFNTREFARFCGHPSIGPGGLKCPCCAPAGDGKRKMRRAYRRNTKLALKRQEEEAYA